tara:strand:+ start:1338 stop:1574 length:237 start_codon:yes stop_codon:yes gene_type:complete
MENYKFAHIEKELENPVIQNTNVNYSIGGNRVMVTLEFTSDNSDEIHTLTLGGMVNSEVWSDEDIISFSVAEFEKFKV